jgi:hypothetical protein
MLVVFRVERHRAVSRSDPYRFSTQQSFEKIKKNSPSGEDWKKPISKKRGKKRVEKRREYE